VTALPGCLLLSPAFKAAELIEEARALPADAWLAHFNSAYYEGDWSGVALRSPGGRISLYPDPNARDPYRDTIYFERCPKLRESLLSLHTPVSSIRFLRLGSGARILEHRDYQIGVDYGEVRLHMPLETNPQVEFELDGRRVEMRAGECWYVDVTRQHRVFNGGQAARIHLVVDCAVNDWLRVQFDDALRTAGAE
jgi:hypothetical protein